MFFHLIWIKEKNWNNYDLDVLLQWWDEDFIRKFLANRWVVIVSISEFKEEPQSFWNILINVVYNDTTIQILIKWDDLWERIYFVMSLWLRPVSVNFIYNPIDESQMKELIEATLSRIKEEDSNVKRQEEIEEMKEKKKYEESWIKDWLRIINANIDRIEQILKAWEWILWWSEIKQLDSYLNEMKKIRLWTNFNKMVTLILDAQALLKNAEKEVLAVNESNQFLINKNSSVTNIDVLREYFDTNRNMEKAKLQPAWLSTSEMVKNLFGSNFIYLKLLRKDTTHIFENSSFNELFDIVMKFVEYTVLLILMVVTIVWMFGNIFWIGNFSLYLLPAVWWLWLLIYLFNSLWLKWVFSRIIWFAALVFIYRQGLVLLLHTFAL